MNTAVEGEKEGALRDGARNRNGMIGGSDPDRSRAFDVAYEIVATLVMLWIALCGVVMWVAGGW